MEITIPSITHDKAEIVKSLPDKIILHEEYLEYKWNTTQKDIEDGIPQPERLYMGNTIVLKKHISELSAFYSEAHNRYQLTISTIQTENTFAPVFASFKEANDVRNKILQWLISTTPCPAPAKEKS